ncbi:MAG TPA: YihY/virulence factor BrkB family protein [Nitrospiraceae bacterium]|nr:YihY/virulence factor BrkB family protein [Nitrospiraceae bacterium]
MTERASTYPSQDRPLQANRASSPASSSWHAAWSLAKKTAEKWGGDPAPRFAAALAYYTAFAIVPLVVLVVMVSAVFMGEDTARGSLHRQVVDLIGEPSGNALFHLIDHWRRVGEPLDTVVVALGVFVIAAGRVMDQLQDALDCVWGLKSKRPPGLLKRIKQRFFSRLGLLGIAFMLLVSLIVSAVFSIGAQAVIGTDGDARPWLRVASAVISYLVLALLFAMIYKWVPQAKVAWKDVWMGALLTTLLYVVGSIVIVVWLGHSALVTFYGGAGSLVLILLWAHYASHVFLFGASFIAVYASEYGSHVAPAAGAVAVRPATESDEEEAVKA